MSSNAAFTPVEVRRLGTHAVRITWNDGLVSEVSNRHLRDHCPCAVCREAPNQVRLPIIAAQAAELYAKQIGLVGRYALSIQWSDGHDSGIYSYATLREICASAAQDKDLENKGLTEPG